MKNLFTTFVGLLLVVATVGISHAVSVGDKEADNSVEAQLEAFKVHEDFEVNLFADESMGIANPVAMHWDDQGRLWVLTTLTYAQLKPGEKPNDTLVILEDTDGDGKADKSSTFVDGLNMPMGFAIGDGGVYVGEGPDLLFFHDEDGDGKADSREVVLTGFGTGDTHQNISNFTWGPDGCLYFAQGLHCYSLVETPWGIVRGDTAGFWKFDPETLRLTPYGFPSNTSQNPCGIVFDKKGSIFIKSNNRELIYATPALIPTTHQNNLVPIASIGVTPGKSMGGEYVDSPHLPDWIQNNILIAGYYSNRVSAFPLVEDGAGYAAVEPVEVLASEHTSFRPVEIRIGPDGAIYVADWFNPIIGHYQASLRHPDRDKEHGRVWRVSAKGREKASPTYHFHRPGTSDIIDKHPPGAETMLLEDEDPYTRLSGIVMAANDSPEKGLVSILTALDHPRDRFIDYALEQSVHALASYWVPAAKAGELKFEKPEHLGYALNILGGEDALEIAKARLSAPDATPEGRARMATVIAANGSSEDLGAVLKSGPVTEDVLTAMADSWPKRKVKPAGGVAGTLKSLLADSNLGIQYQAVRLAGLWQINAVAPDVLALAQDSSGEIELRGEAAKSYARIARAEAIPALAEMTESENTFVRAAAIDALASIAPQKAATIAAPLLGSVSNKEEATGLLRPFLSRKGAPEILAGALETVSLEADAAGHLATGMSEMGRSDEKLLSIIQGAMGIQSGEQAYDTEFVAALAKEVVDAGNADAGKEIYHRAQLTCVACHQVGGQGGILGPSLDAVGAGLPVNLLIESVLWPDRQLKEGYFSIAVSTKGGDTFSGYKDKEEEDYLYLRDTASGEVKAIQKREITNLQNLGTIMPPSLTNSLSREELRDLIAYLASLKG